MNELPGTGMEESRNRLSLSPSPSRESNASNLEDDLDLSRPNSSFDKTRGRKDSGSHSDKQGQSPKSSRENTPEKRKSSDRDSSSSDREKTPDEGTSSKTKAKSSESPDGPQASTSKDAPSTSKDVPSTSKDAPSTSKDAPSTSKDAPSTSKDAPSTSKEAPSTSKDVPSTSPSSKPPKRKNSDSDEEVTKRFKRQDEDRRKMQVLVSNFSEEQLNRYEMYRRATFPRPSVKKLMQNITGSTVSQNVVIAMSGIAKVFVGEVLETALDVSEKWGDSGPLHPKHLREAVRILNAKGMMPSTKNKKCLF